MEDIRYRFLAYLEKQAQRGQGKGFGAKSIKHEVRAALPFLPQTGAVVFDIGANKGLWAKEMLRVAGPRLARLYCVEPSRHNFAAIEALGDPRVSLLKTALSDKAGEQTLYSDREGSGIASLADRRLDYHGVTMGVHETVPVTTLDALLAELNIATVDFAKFDIEGYEYNAFLGGEKAFARGAIKACAFEFGGTNIDTRTYLRDFWFFLTERNYRIATINPLGRPHPIARYHEGLEHFTATNYVAWRA
ncbi:MAG TPA: FkbM family methyltransferase [Rhizomicrobium sp.]|nr:FkbM family methyltransferase [Rhizomicrobium sp.]